MKICAITVWYNPTEMLPGHDAAKNIATYAQDVGRVYVVDNSEGDNRGLVAPIANAVYIPNGKNIGIAAALNIGCERAYADGYDAVLTMDQDSYWEPGAVERYARFAAEQFAATDIALVAASYDEHSITFARYVMDKIASLWRGRPRVPDMEFLDSVICSGNIVRLSAWKAVGGFDEQMFIDEVDSDFCFSLREQGFRIVQSNVHKFHHQLGDSARRVHLLDADSHSDARLYYIIRNHIYMTKKHPALAHRHQYPKGLRRIVVRKCLFARHPLCRIRVVRRAIADAKKMEVPLAVRVS